jgi:hypothetical protein
VVFHLLFHEVLIAELKGKLLGEVEKVAPLQGKKKSRTPPRSKSCVKRSPSNNNSYFSPHVAEKMVTIRRLKLPRDPCRPLNSI